MRRRIFFTNRPLSEMLRQQRDVFLALPQRSDLNEKHLEAVAKVLTTAAG